jgi:hypothetical protein
MEITIVIRFDLFRLHVAHTYQMQTVCQERFVLYFLMDERLIQIHGSLCRSSPLQ